VPLPPPSAPVAAETAVIAPSTSNMASARAFVARKPTMPLLQPVDSEYRMAELLHEAVTSCPCAVTLRDEIGS